MRFLGFHGFGDTPSDGIVAGDIMFRNQLLDTLWHRSVWPLPNGVLAPGMYQPKVQPLDPAVLAKARENLQKIQDAIDLGSPSSARAADRMNRFRAVAGGAVKALDNTVDQLGLGVNSGPALEGMYAVINTELTKLAGENWPDPIDEIANAEAAAQAAAARADAIRAAADAAHAAAVAQQQQTQASINAAQAAADHAQQTAAIAQAHAEAGGSGFPFLTVALIGVPVLAVGALALASRSKSSKKGKRR